MFPVLAIVAFIVVFALLAYHSHLQNQKRLAELTSLAQQIGWRFDPESDYDFDGQYSQFSAFCRGSRRYAYNTLTGAIQIGDESWPARMGDYHYQTTSSDGKRTRTHHHYFSYLLVQLPYPSLPDLRLRREGLFDKLASSFGFDDIDFESAEFSKRFHVKSSDKKFAYDVVHPAMMEFLLASNAPAVEIERSDLCLSDESIWTPAEYREQLVWTERFLKLWPTHLVAELRSR
jgi:hypothetical protein